jgi:hypothetical protein
MMARWERVVLLSSIAAFGAVALVIPADARRSRAPICPGGRFESAAPVLADPLAKDTAVILAGNHVSISDGCDPVIGKLAYRAQGTMVIATWKGCGTLAGPVRLRAKIDPDTCNVMTGKLTAKKSKFRRTFSAHRAVIGPKQGPTGGSNPGGGNPPGGNSPGGGPPGGNPPSGNPPGGGEPPIDPNEDTFQVIQERVFDAHGCNVTTCHARDWAGRLDLRPGIAYPALVGVLAENDAARQAGKKRVVSGDAANSFLSQKLHGTLAPGEGNKMPETGPPLSQLELDLIDAWINGGAPATGTIGNVPIPPTEDYVPTTPAPPPPGGYQIVLPGPTLQPNEEQEGCYWVPAPNPTDMAIDHWEIWLNPGTHHFLVTPWQAAGAPVVDQWQVNNFGCFNGGGSLGNALAGAPYAPYFVAGYPSGVAVVLKAGSFLGLNAHYHNYWNVPIDVKVWINIFPYQGTPEHISQALTDLDAMYSINVPPFTQKLQPGHYVNTSGQPQNIYGIGGHMHKRGLRFRAFASDGTEIFEDYDWSHPNPRTFDPPMVLQPNDYIDYDCLHDNGVERPVRLDANGNPTTLRFGVTTDDEMCILIGAYYSD